MGSLHSQISQIPEDHVDFILEYFCGRTAPLDGDSDSDIEEFLDSFAGRFRDATGQAGAPASDWLASCAEAMKERYRVLGWEMGWLDYAAFDALRACGAREICVGDVLANDAWVEAYGNLWRYLDEVCTDGADRASAVALRKLMLDRRYEDRRFLVEVQGNVHCLALLRPEEVRRLHGSIPLLERFRAAVRQSADRFRTADLFREDLQRLTDYLASVEAPGCLPVFSIGDDLAQRLV
jgi:hypothetical protein